mmetsp:Transcript_40811/g.41416  ORF Transcript_40811/g.41416 Transcript_40811/m.41416 type:complete len:195 (+) Transcript_40811:1-585(+)
MMMMMMMMRTMMLQAVVALIFLYGRTSLVDAQTVVVPIKNPTLNLCLEWPPNFTTEMPPITLSYGICDSDALNQKWTIVNAETTIFNAVGLFIPVKFQQFRPTDDDDLDPTYCLTLKKKKPVLGDKCPTTVASALQAKTMWISESFDVDRGSQVSGRFYNARSNKVLSVKNGTPKMKSDNDSDDRNFIAGYGGW